jgi:hypothetical protein
MLFTAQAQSFVQPNLAFLAPAGMTGVGKAVETAVEPAGETEPVVQEGGHAPISQLAGPIIEVTKTSPARSEVAGKARRGRAARSSRARGTDEDLRIAKIRRMAACVVFYN